jgi:aspartate carbamoyltransferase catalytic subunit
MYTYNEIRGEKLVQPTTKTQRHVLTSEQFDPSLIDLIFTHADATRRNVEHQRRHHRIGGTLAGHILYRLFFKESTRTYESFGFAARHLGMGVMGTQDVGNTSIAKGESLEDTIKTINCYLPSIIVMRSANTGDAARAAAVSEAPIINGGDGSGEHPTQALLDLYTVRQELGRMENIHFVMGVDPYHSRVIRSLALLAAKYPGNSFTFVSPGPFRLQEDVKQALTKAGASFDETTEMSALRSADIVCWNRFQKERHTESQKAYLEEHPEEIENYSLGRREVESLPKHARIIDPLPRVREIKTEVDSDPRAAYIRQMYYGMIVRMALIEWTLGYL